ncbi:hypothetical protein SAMN02744102_01594 [Paenibacillus barengoltzii]|nr:hypothetical protein SAMN02744102_01594 [Paenibacillus barengoltzii]
MINGDLDCITFELTRTLNLLNEVSSILKLMMLTE